MKKTFFAHRHADRSETSNAAMTTTGSQAVASGAMGTSSANSASNEAVESLGLFQLYPDPEIESSKTIETTVDVIAVHGLGGHAFNTWTEGGRLWLRDFLPSDLPKARVLTFGYNSGIAFTNSKSTLRDFATMLLENVKQHRRRNAKDGRKTLFVCHSLGGIVFKQALIIAHEKETRYKDILESVAGVVFLGTPHKGADIAFWGTLLTKLANFAVAGKLRDDLLASLKPKSKELGDICSQFVERGMKLQIFSLYERHITPGLESLVVDEFSAILHLPNETPIPIEADHRGMCKYMSSAGNNYHMVSECIMELVDSLAESSPESLLLSDQREIVNRLRVVGLADVVHKIPTQWGRSGQWLLIHEKFQSWLKLGGCPTLWIYGPPGSGKTVLMKTILDFLSSQSSAFPDSVVQKPLYFFFDDKDPLRKSSLDFSRSILHQILSSDQTSSLIRYLDENILKEASKNEDHLWACLMTIFQKARGFVFYFIIDAVDETLRNTQPAQLTVLDRMQQLLSIDLSGHLKVLISDRAPAPYEFQTVTKCATLDINNESTHSGVEEFIKSQIRTKLEKFRLPYEAGEAIEERILEISDGNFLHATLAWNHFSQGLKEWSRASIQTRLAKFETLSLDLETTYCQLLRRITKNWRQRVRVVFAILRVCKETLTSAQLALFTLLNDDSMEFDTPEFRTDSAYLQHHLSELCGYVVTRDENGLANFSHLSAKDLFASKPGRQDDNEQILSQYRTPEAEAHALMFRTCIRVLGVERNTVRPWIKQLDMQKVKEWGADYLESHTTRFMRSPGFLYALRHWFNHYQAGLVDPRIDDQVATFFQSPHSHDIHAAWLVLPTPDLSPHANRFEASRIKLPIFQAITRGDCPRVVTILVQRGININFKISNGITPLSWAIICGRNETVVAILRNEELLPNLGEHNHEKPIHHAVFCERERFYDPFFLERLMGDSRINLDIRGLGGRTPLLEAIHHKNFQAAEMLLDDSRVEIWARGDDGQSAYEKAYMYRGLHQIMLKLMNKLPRKSSAILSIRISGSSQFIFAGIHNWVDMEEKILQQDPEQLLFIDPDTKMNALSYYAHLGRKEKLHWILERLPASFPIQQTSSENNNILHLCANHNLPDLVDLLRNKFSMKPLQSDHYGRTLLHWALEHSWPLTRAQLLDYSCGDLDKQDKDGLTALHLAILERNLESIAMLLELGANISLRDKDGQTAAHMAAHIGFRKGLEHLIESPIREFGRTRGGLSLLHLMCPWFEGELIHQFILRKHALVDVLDRHKRTPLHYAAAADNQSAVATLLDSGAKMDAKDDCGKTPLHDAIRSGSTNAVETLLERGADTNVIDSFGQTCLHQSCRYGSEQLTKTLLDRNIDIDAIDKFGKIALHRACERGYNNLIPILIASGSNYQLLDNNYESCLDMAIRSRNVSTVEVVIQYLHRSSFSADVRRIFLDKALELAIEIEFPAIQGTLINIGAVADPARVHYLYAPEEEREDRWPLILPRLGGGYRYRHEPEYVYDGRNYVHVSYLRPEYYTEPTYETRRAGGESNRMSRGPPPPPPMDWPGRHSTVSISSTTSPTTSRTRVPESEQSGSRPSSSRRSRTPHYQPSKPSTPRPETPEPSTPRRKEREPSPRRRTRHNKRSTRSNGCHPS